MMRGAGKQPAPLALPTLLAAIEGLEAPENVLAALTSIQIAVFSDNPRSALSKRCCRLREARPDVFRELWRWLRTPAVSKAVRCYGAYWAWRIWRRACAAINRGMKPHVAFGMNKPGRPAPMHFSAVEDAAMWAEYLHQRCGVPSERAGRLAQNFAGMSREDRRTMQRMRGKFRSCGNTLDGLPETLRMKYPQLKE